MADKKPQYKILITDDDKFLLDMYSIKFTENNFEVSVANSGEDALDKVEDGLRPDVYLVDLLMPKLDGFQLINKLREKGIGKEAAIVILSNLGQKEDIDKGLKLGVDGYIVKASATPSEVVNKTIDIVKTKLKH
jgi:DNA-binding response OmpR family regulator